MSNSFKREEGQPIIDLLVHSAPELQRNIFDEFSQNYLKYLQLDLAPHTPFGPYHIIRCWEEFPHPLYHFPRPLSLPLIFAYSKFNSIKKWNSYWKSYSRNESLNGTPFPPQFYKMDPTENSSRMRRGIIENHKPDDYEGCASLADTQTIRNINYSEEKSEYEQTWEIEIAKGLHYDPSRVKVHEIFYQGLLVKRGHKFTTWKPRYFLLKNSHVEYRDSVPFFICFAHLRGLPWITSHTVLCHLIPLTPFHNKQNGKKVGTISLLGAHVAISPESSTTDFQFEIHIPNRTYFLIAQTRCEMDEWARNLRLAIPAITHTPPPPNPAQGEFSPIFQPSPFVTDGKMIYKCNCQLITGNLKRNREGVLEITDSHLTFFGNHPTNEPLSVFKYFQRWNLNRLSEVYQRSYSLRKTGLEFFLTDKTGIFFNLPSSDTVTTVLNTLSELKLEHFVNLASTPPTKILSRSQLTKKWQERAISNFDYLMALNTISGRTFNDLNQYPVFPWVLSDYTSETIDLFDPKSYRDLSKPVGALNPTRLEQIQLRFENFDDPNVPKFHHGTLYSNLGSKLFSDFYKHLHCLKIQNL